MFGGKPTHDQPVPVHVVAVRFGIAVAIAGGLTLLASWLWPVSLQQMGFGRIINTVILFGTLGAIAGALVHRYKQKQQQADRDNNPATRDG